MSTFIGWLILVALIGCGSLLVRKQKTIGSPMVKGGNLARRHAGYAKLYPPKTRRR